MERPKGNKKRCVVLGDVGCGKTSLISLLLGGDFPSFSSPPPHPPSPLASKTSSLVEGWRFLEHSSRSWGLRKRIPVKADVYLICYSVLSRYSCDLITSRWLPLVKKINPEALIIIVALKKDLLSPYGAPDLTWFDVGREEGPIAPTTPRSLATIIRLPRLPRLPRFSAPWTRRPSKALSMQQQQHHRLRVGLADLPDELLLLVFDRVNTPDLGRLAQVCRRFSWMAADFQVWRGRSRIKPPAYFCYLTPKDMPGLGKLAAGARLSACSALTGEGVGALRRSILGSGSPDPQGKRGGNKQQQQQKRRPKAKGKRM